MDSKHFLIQTTILVIAFSGLVASHTLDNIDGKTYFNEKYEVIHDNNVTPSLENNRLVGAKKLRPLSANEITTLQMKKKQQGELEHNNYELEAWVQQFAYEMSYYLDALMKEQNQFKDHLKWGETVRKSYLEDEEFKRNSRLLYLEEKQKQLKKELQHEAIERNKWLQQDANHWNDGLDYLENQLRQLKEELRRGLNKMGLETSQKINYEQDNKLEVEENLIEGQLSSEKEDHDILSSHESNVHVDQLMKMNENPNTQPELESDENGLLMQRNGRKNKKVSSHKDTSDWVKNIEQDSYNLKKKLKIQQRKDAEKQILHRRKQNMQNINRPK